MQESDVVLNEFAKGIGDLEKALEFQPNNPNRMEDRSVPVGAKRKGQLGVTFNSALRSQVWNRSCLIATPTLYLVLQWKWYPKAGVELGVIDDAVPGTPPSEFPFQDQPVDGIELQI